ncbi:hypothetical protein ACX80D_04450 [Arthrobacter sp. Sr24]
MRTGNAPSELASDGELISDHSLIVDVFNRPDASARNSEIDFKHNKERYELLLWPNSPSTTSWWSSPESTTACSWLTQTLW